MKPMTCEEALLLLLDQIDFRNGACSPTSMVGACIPPEVFARCDEALKAAKGLRSEGRTNGE